MSKLKSFTFGLFILLFISFTTIKANIENPVIVNEAVSIRAKTETSNQGMKFSATLKDSNSSHGFYVAYGDVSLSELKNALKSPINGRVLINDKEVFEVNINGVDKNNNFSVVLTGIPEVGYLDNISVFAYADGYISNSVTKNVLDVAIKMEENNISSSATQDIISSFDDLFYKGQFDENFNYFVSTSVYNNQNSFVDLNNYDVFLQSEGFVIPIPTKEGFNFKGFYGNENFSGNPVTTATSSKTYYSKWEAVLPDEYTIIFNKNGGDWPMIEQAGYTNRDEMIKDFLTEFYYFLNPSDLSLNDFMHGSSNTSGFDGTYNDYISDLRKLDDKTINPSATTFINLPKYNKWLPLLELINDYIGLNEAQKNQFWTSDWTAKPRMKSFMLKENLWGSEKESIVNELTNKIPEELAAGNLIQVNVPDSYNVDSEEITLPIPEKDNYDFLGWYNSSDFKGNVITKIPKGSTGNKTFYAKWKDNTPDPSDNENPEFAFTEDYEDVIVVNWNKNYNPLKGVTAIDSVDGNLTSQIVIANSIDNQSYGRQYISLKVTNSRGKTTTLQRAIEVVWNYDVTFVGHGGSYYGLMNSEEAILYAIHQLKYQAVEVDLKQTKDGVFILCHDNDFGGKVLAQENWSVLKDVKVTQSRNTGIPSQNGSVTNNPYTTGLITLERYLEICKDINVKAVIELKSSKGITNTDQSRMRVLMDVIESKDMLSDVIFLGSQYNCLIWTRQNGYGYIPCQYLVNSIESETFLNRCIDNNLDISFNISQANSTTWINKYKSHGLEVACYTFNQWSSYSDLQNWINKGVDYVTCDWHLMDQVTLPESSDDPIIPDEPEPGTYTKVQWANKQAFIDEFYSDFYNWLKENGNRLTNVTVSGTSINMNRLDANVTTNNANDLKDVYIYDFELTFGTLIYQPVNVVIIYQ